jgi:hypothetical protein
MGCVAPMMHQFVLQRPPETLHRGVVRAVSLPIPGRNQAILAEVLLVDLGPYGEPRSEWWSKPGHGRFAPTALLEGITHHVRRPLSPHGMPDDLTGEPILHTREIQPAFRGWY